MPPRDFYSPENVRKAAEAIRQQYQEGQRQDTRIRRAMLDEGLESGDIDLRYALQRRAEDSGEYDPDYFSVDDLSDAELRQYATPDEFGGDVPFRGYDIDPYDENYVGYRLASQNPEVLELIRQPLIPRSSDVKQLSSNRLFNEIRAGRIEPRDLRELYRSTSSSFLSNAAGDPEAYDAASFIEQQRTGNPEARIDPDLDELIAERSDVLRQFVERPIEAVNRLDENRRRLRDTVARARSAAGIQGNLFNPGTTRQIDELETRGSNLLDPQTLEGLEENSNRLNEIVRDLNQIERRAVRSGDTEASQTAGQDTVLPQIREFLGDEGVQDALRTIRSRERAERRDAAYAETLAREALTRRSIPGQLQSLDEASRRVMSPRVLDDIDDQYITGGGRQNVLPGLWEAVEEARQKTTKEQVQRVRQGIDAVLGRYPELKTVLEASPRAEGRPRNRGGKAFDQYQQFADIEQRYASPEQRSSAYEQVLNQFPEETRNQISGQLQRIEADYTSGNTAKQRAAVEELEALGGTLRDVEVPSFRPTRPVIGGGRYVTREQIKADPELNELAERIEQRAADFKSEFNKLERDQQRAIFGERARTRYENPTLSLLYDPDTQSVVETDRGNPDAYRVRVAGAGNSFGDIKPMTLADLGDRAISENAIRFLAENPIVNEASVAFETAIPGGPLSHDIKGRTEGLPKAVQDRFTTFIRDQALKGAQPGTLVFNVPITSSDLLQSRLAQGETEKTSSTIRRLQPFAEKGQAFPSLRGMAYQSAGFGPVDVQNRQYTFISPEGEAVPIQFFQSEPGLQGRVQNTPSGPRVTQGALPANTPRYFGSAIPGIGPEEVSQIGRNIRRTPASLLPGAADLIPTREAVRRGFQEGPVAMGQQMGADFLAGLPLSIPAAAVLSAPAVAPLAPAIGAGLVTVAGGEALDEAVKQQTGEGIVPKLRQFIGTEERTGATAKPKPTRPYVTPRIVPTQPRNPVIQEAQNRLGLARERFNPAKGEFGLSELLFGR